MTAGARAGNKVNGGRGFRGIIEGEMESDE
jgi:hypothetical protein